ncbi:MAG TPA: pentapeptide repeat-containing protein [Galbitalea sp.]
MSAAPKIRPIVLPALDDWDGAAPLVDDEREAERFADADLSELELMGVRFAECEFVGGSMHDADLRGARFVETVITRTNTPVLRAPASSWRDVSIEQSRIGSGELYESNWQGVRFVHCKLGYLNLRASELRDLEFVDCTIDELDLGGATAVRLAFARTSVGTLDVTRSSLGDVDLRGAELAGIRGIGGLTGATISEYQLAELAPHFATHLGIVIA